MAGSDSLVIMATYNEAGNLAPLVSRVLAYPEFDVVVIDDNSPDGTGAVADDLVRRFPGRVSVLHRSHKQGLGTALVLGYRHALTNGHDCVYVAGGSVLNRSPWRRLLSRAASAYTGTLLSLPIRDPMGGYKGYRRSVLEALDLGRLRSRGYAIQAEMSFRCRQRGFAIVELPTVFTDRVHGRSKMTGAVVLEALVMPLVLLVRRPFEAANSGRVGPATPVTPGSPD
jgi:dolichol-phosphate mannosyltransferase